MRWTMVNVTLPPDYGYLNKRDYGKIDLFVNGVYKASTTWARNTAIARLAYAQKERLPLYQVSARRD
jgi:hypothetical protein